MVKYLVLLYSSVLSTEEQWLSFTEKFESRWQYPNAIGAVDGKYVVIHKRIHGGSCYYKYKHTHSPILMTIAGSRYECLYRDVGTNVWNKCGIPKALESNKLSLPRPTCLPGGSS